MTIVDGLRVRGGLDRGSFRAEMLDLSEASGASRVEDLLTAFPDLRVHDEIIAQVRGLLETRDPSGTLDQARLAQAVEDHLGEEPHRYGFWAFYPWSLRLVHVLPEEEFRELRTSRNRNKITLEEQARLCQLHIGIVGLSIGQAAAVTLTLEEIGGLLVLADFDDLELSNLNRLRAGVHSLGVNKAVLAAREIAEINPYARVEVWKEGVNAANIDAFLNTGGRPLDLVFEECDDLYAKFLVRQRARHHRIAVLMETSDRGLMDIERFDLEPDRPLFHGLAGEVVAEDLRGMSTYDKVPVVMRIIGRQAMSDRMAASMIDIESTLKSWPQLASEVALGAGLNVDTARRIALGQLSASGRFYVDMHAHIHDDMAQPEGHGTEESDMVQVSVEAHGLSLPPLQRTPGPLDHDDVRTLVAWITTAMSGGNIQPWSFTFAHDVLTLWHDVERSASLLDVDHRASYVAFGSVLENLVLVCPMLGLEPVLDLFPSPADPTRICDVRLRTVADRGPVDPLVHAIAHRVTNRKLGNRQPLLAEHRLGMERAAALHEAHVQWVESDAGLDEIADILGQVDRLRLLTRQMHQEMMGEVRWNLAEVEGTRDGVDVATLELTATDLAAMRVIRSWPVLRMLGLVGGGAGLERPSRKAIDACAAVGLVTMAGIDPEAFVRAGRGLHRLWLRANLDGVAFQPMTTVTYLFHRLEHRGGEGLSDPLRHTLQTLRKRFLRLFDIPEGHGEPMLFRVAYVEAPTARSLRRHVDDVLTFPG